MSLSKVCSAGIALAEAWVARNFCVETLPIAVDEPRSVLSLGTSDLLVLERGTNSVVLLYDTQKDHIVDSRRTVASAPGLNHGMALSNNYLYASSSTTVYRWRLNSNYETIGEREIVINNMSSGGHATRTLVFDKLGRLYVSIGSDLNMSSHPYRINFATS